MHKFFNRSCASAGILLAIAFPVFPQSTAQKRPKPANAVAVEFTSSPAYVELLLRKTDLRSELESLALEYTEEYPPIREMRFVLGLLDRDMARLAKVQPSEGSRLTVALGKLMVRKIELETNLWNLQRNYNDEHPDVRRAKRKVEIYENAIAEVLK